MIFHGASVQESCVKIALSSPPVPLIKERRCGKPYWIDKMNKPWFIQIQGGIAWYSSDNLVLQRYRLGVYPLVISYIAIEHGP